MHLKEYWPELSKQEREILAAKALTTVGHLRNVVYGATISQSLVARLEFHSGGKVTRVAHFPETYAVLWPGLGGRVPIVANEVSASVEVVHG